MSLKCPQIAILKKKKKKKTSVVHMSLTKLSNAGTSETLVNLRMNDSVSKR
jgi:hypothetical protein